MGQYITAALIGSLGTLVVQAIINAISESVKYKRELRSLVFQRKLEVVEKAISWCQESADMYSSLQMTLREYNNDWNIVIIQKLQVAFDRLNKLSQETDSRLNAIYLYYDFSDIEAKYNGRESVYSVNKLLILIAEVSDKISKMDSVNFDEQVYKELQNERVNYMHQLADAVDSHIYIIDEIERRLRNEYREYLK